VPESTAIERFSAWVTEFTERVLRGYLEQLKGSNVVRETREINDPVWATISLSPFETLIVDSPLIQRLRRIRQLGVVHWVYPGCVHTRFEHSIGALHQMQRLIDSLDRLPSCGDAPPISSERAALLRLCALTHDIGYGAMSHVFEKALLRYDAVEAIRTAFSKAYKTDPPPSLSEIVAYHMIGSPAFAELLRVAQEKSDGPHPPRDAAECARKAITGQIVYDDVPLLQELIAGPFDADKLDYMQRDALMCGIPAVTDVPRLVGKVRARWVQQEDLPPRIRARVTKQERYLMFGIAFAGSRTLDELVIARVLLFDKVYRHQKVRAIEAMVIRLLETLAGCYSGDVFEIPFLFSDDSLLDMDRSVQTIPGFKNGSANQSLRIVEELSNRLRERRLFVRSFVFAMHLPELDQNIIMHRGMGAFLDEIQGAEHEKVLRKIADEIKAIAKLTGDDLSGLADQSLRSYLWLDPPAAGDHSEQIDRAFLIQGDQIIRYSEHSKEVPRWSQAYLAKKDVGYLFCLPELQNLAFIATEKLLATGRYRFRVPPSSVTYLKLDQKMISTLREPLHASGYYQDVPFASRPLRARLRKADIDPVCEAVRDSLNGYCGPAGETGQTAAVTALSNERITLWLSQFEETEFIEVAIAVTRKIRLFGRAEMVQSIREFIRLHPEFTDPVIVPFGDARDSGAVVAYLAGDIGKPVEQMDTALTGTAPIIFVDDCIGSGGQADNIMADWFGTDKRADLGEAQRQTLTSQQQDGLLNRKVGFVFTTGLDEGVQRLEQLCQHFKLDATVVVGFQNDLPTLFDSDLSALPDHGRFVEKCRAVAEELFSNRADWDEAKKAQRLLGYGNKGLLITFLYNTPAQTLTCMWSGGIYHSLEWSPLLPRRKKN
jgi:deoxynucleoside triphosphate triphosphohydrolase SAMHD1